MILGGALAVAVAMYPVVYYGSKEKDNVIGMDAEGRVMRIPELREAVVSDAAVARFCGESVQEIGTYNFEDFNIRFRNLRGRFTEPGWRGYNKTMMDNKVPLSVKEHNLIQVTVPQEPCAVIDGKPKGGRYWWKLRVKARRQATSGSRSAAPQELMIEMEIVRVGIAEAKEMIAIEKYSELGGVP